jgi:hypothetical protein
MYLPRLFIALLGLFLAFSSPDLMAQTAKVNKLPFHGKLTAVDTAAQSITLSGKSARVFHLTPTTKITDGAGNPSSFSAATVGEDVGGSYDKATMNLFSVRFGAKTGAKSKEKPAVETTAPAPVTSSAPSASVATKSTPAANAPAAAPAAKKQRFSGKVVSVDAAGNSLVVHGETLKLDSSSKLTDAKGAAITLSDLAAGDKISGSGMKEADGSITVATLKKSK